MSLFTVARNPDPESTLPYLIRLPLGAEGLVLKAREPWPRTARVYCHRAEEGWPAEPEVLEEVPVRVCRRRGAAVDLVLERGRDSRSQVVFTRLRGGREAIFWQTAKTARAARPGARVPGRRAAGLAPEDLMILVDSRERYPYRFVGRKARTERRALRAGDYAVELDGDLVAAVERKSLGNLVSGLTDGSLAFQLADLAELPRAALVVEDRYPAVFRLEHLDPAWIADLLASVQVRYPAVPIVFGDSRKHAEEWTYRFLAAALVAAVETPLDPSGPGVRR